MSKFKKWLVPSLVIISILASFVSGCGVMPDDMTSNERMSEKPTVGEDLDPSGNPFAHSFSDIDDHASRHENAGADEINVADLSGLLADDQHVIDAEALAAAVAGIVSGAPTDGEVAIWTDADTIEGAEIVSGSAIFVASSTSTAQEKAGAIASGGTVCNLTDDANDIHSAIALANNGIIQLGTGIFEFDTGAIEIFNNCIIRGQGSFFEVQAGTKGTIIKLMADTDGIRLSRFAKLQNLTVLCNASSRAGTAVEYYINDTISDRNMIPFENVHITGGDNDSVDCTGTGLKLTADADTSTAYIELLDLSRVFIHGFDIGLHMLSDAASGETAFLNGITLSDFNISSCVHNIKMETTGAGNALVDGNIFQGLIINVINVAVPTFETDDCILMVHGATTGAIQENQFGPAFIWDEDNLAAGGNALVAGTGCINNSFLGRVRTDWTGAGEHNTVYSPHEANWDLIAQPTKAWEGTTLGVSGMKIRWYVGEASGVAAGDLCYIDSGDEFSLTDADAKGTTAGTLAFALQDGADGDYIWFFLYGVIREGFTFTAANKPIYVGVTSGEVQEAAPTGKGDCVRLIGYSFNDSNHMLFNPANDWYEVGEYDGYIDEINGIPLATEMRTLKPNIVRWVLPGWNYDAAEAFAVTAGRIYYTPIFVTEDTTYDRIGVEVTVGAAGSAELWIFEWASGLPGDKIADLGDVADTTNVILNQIVIDLDLVGGTYYFLAIRCTGTPTLNGIDDRSCSLIPVPSCNPSFRVYGTIMYVTAALADPAPAPTGITHIGYASLGLRES